MRFVKHILYASICAVTIPSISLGRTEYISKSLYDKIKYSSNIPWSKIDKSLEALEWLEKTYAPHWRQDYYPILETIRNRQLKVGYEIGTAFGLQAMDILRRTNATLHTIDPFVPLPLNFHLSSLQKNEWNMLHTIVETRLSGFKNRAHLIRQHPRIAVQYIADHSIDFLCIDARYTCQDVRTTLSSWLQKVKKGGYIFIAGKPGGDISKMGGAPLYAELENFSVKNDLETRVMGNTYQMRKRHFLIEPFS